MNPPSVAPNALQASVCDEQLRSIGGEIALSETRRPTSDVDVATPLVISILHSRCDFQQTSLSQVQWYLLVPIVHRPHFDSFAEFNP